MTSLSEDDLSENYRILTDNLEYCKYIVLQLESGYNDEQLFENAFEFITFLKQKFDFYNIYISFDSSNIIYSDIPEKCKDILDFIYISFEKFYNLVKQLELKGENEEYVMSNEHIYPDFINIFNTAIKIQYKMLECYEIFIYDKNINNNLINIIDNLKII